MKRVFEKSSFEDNVAATFIKRQIWLVVRVEHGQVSYAI